MKKLLIYSIFILALFSTRNAFATHVAGAEMTYTSSVTDVNLVTNTVTIEFNFTLKVYRDCGGVNLGANQTIYFDFGRTDGAAFNNGNPNYQYGFQNADNTIDMVRQSISEIPLSCSSQETNCNGGAITGYEIHTYTGSETITVDMNLLNIGGVRDVIRFYFNNFARNNAITNVAGAGGFSLYNQSFFNLNRAIDGYLALNPVPTGASTPYNNSTPSVSQPPVFYGCVGQEINFSNIAVDNEGNDIIYRMVNPLEADNGTEGNAGYTPNNLPFIAPEDFQIPIPSTGPFTLDIVTGQLTFTPNTIGVYVFSIMIIELNANGQIVGSTMRDYQFSIRNCMNPIQPNATGPDFDTTTYTYNACYNEPFCFDILGVGDGIDTNFFRYNNEIDTTGDPLTSFTTITQNADSTVATFCWDPDTLIGNETFTVTSSLDICPYIQYGTFTYTIHVDTNYLPICMDSVVYLDTNGLYVIDSSYVWDTTVNNTCGISSIAIDRDTFRCADIGTNIVNVTTTFSNGIVRNCIANITVIDTNGPTAICRDTIIYLDLAGTFTIDSSYIDNGSYDSCGIQSIQLSRTDFTCVDTGVILITMYVTDNNGNIDSCTANLTIIDTIPPTAICQDTTIYLDASGSFTIDSSFIDNGSNDPCGIFAISQSTFTCADVGPNNVTLYVNDITNNIDSCSAVVTVLDTTNPTIVCQPATFYLDANGQLIIDTTGLIVSTGDNCSIDSVWINVNDTLYGCNDTGTNTVTIYIQDPSGNIDSCISTITVLDTTTPTIVCQPATLYLDAAGQLIIDTTGLIVSTGDNCSIDSVWVNVNDTLYGCIDTGVHTVTIYVQDPSRNIDSCVSTLTVVDSTIPTIVCQPATLYLDAAGQLIIDTTGLIVSTGDNCSVDSVWVNVNDTLYGCIDTGVNTVTIYVQDPSGNIDSCVSTLTVLDTTAPTIVCQPSTLYLDAAGQLIIDTAGFIVSTGDNCSVDSVWVNVNDTLYGCADTGMNTVTIYIQDPSGNIDSCTSNLTVLDTINPVVICQDSTIYLDVAGNFTIDSSFIDNGSNDACGIQSIQLSRTDFTCIDTGVIVITMYVTDNNGNIDSCTANLTIRDTIPPTALCQDTTIYLDASGSFTIDSSFIDNGSNDPCGIFAISQSTFTCADLGPNNVTLYVNDITNNIDSCTAIVTVLDTTNPTIVCQPATLYLDASGQLIIDTTGLIVSTGDNCSIDSVWVNVNDTLYGCNDTGMNTVTIYVQDPSGNIDSCISTITVLDTTTPTIVCQPATLYLDASGQLIIDTTGLIVSTGDNCSLDSVWVNVDDTLYGCNDTGTNTVTIYVQDPSRNIDSCVSTLTVLDTTAPTIVCQPATLYLDAARQLIIDTTGLIVSTGDNCSVDSVWVNVNDTLYGCNDTGMNTVTIYVQDPSGNIDSCVSVLTVLDTTAPTIVCQPSTLYLDAAGQLIIDTAGFIVSTGDNCTVDSVWVNVSDTLYGCNDTGTNTVTIYVQDPSGNIDSCVSTLTVLDTTAPTIVCQPATLYLDATGQLIIDTTGLIVSTGDNCSVDSVWVNVNDTLYGCNDTGMNTVTIYVQDPSGNIDSCVSTLTVLDTTAPTIVCQPATLYLDANGQLIIDTTGFITSTGDNCSVDSVWVNVNDTLYGCIDTGVNTVTIYVQDPSGNIDSCVSTLTVLDTTAPTIVCQAATLYLDANGQLIVDTTGFITSTGDNCSVDSVWVNPNDTLFGCADTGLNNITIYIQDPSGNIDSCSSALTIIDSINPIVICNDTFVYLDVAGNVTIDSSFIDGGSSDACGIATITLDRYDFTCLDTGLNIVTMYVTDNNGNLDSCSANVNVIDTIGPIAICTDTTIYLDATGNFTIDSSFIDGGSSDPCGIFVISQSQFNCSHIGPNNVKLYVFDLNNNVDSCTAIVTVLDTINPTTVCNDTTIYLDATGNFTIDSSYLNNGSSDACGIVTITLSETNFTCADTGINVITLYVTDNNGNVDSCFANLTVRDSITPIATAGADDSLCGTYTYNLNGNTPPGTLVGLWTVINAPNIPAFDNVNLPNATISGLIEGVYELEWSVTNGPGCNVTRDTVLVYIYDATIANAGNDTNLCNVFSLGLDGNVLTGLSTGVWTYASPSPTVPSFTDATNPNTVVSNLDEGTYTLIWTVSNGNCVDAIDSVVVNVYELPTATAGNDQSQCGRQDAILIGNTPAGSASGMWSIDPTAPNPNTPTFINPNSPVTSLTNLIEGTYTIVWTVSNGSCADATDTLLLTVADSINSVAGNDTNLCAVYTLQLNGNQPNGTANGFWFLDTAGTAYTGTPRLIDSSVYNTTIVGLEEGTYQLLWILQNGVCPFSVDTMIINVWDNPTTYAGVDSSLCAIYNLNLYATPITGTSQGVWTLDATAPNPNVPTITNPTQANANISGLIEGTYTFVWSVTNGPCYSYTDTVRITIFDQPIANAGVDQNLCDVFSTTINATPLTGTSSGTWYLANGTPNAPVFNANTASTVLSNLMEAGVYTLYYEATNGVCAVSRDTIVIRNNPIPVANYIQDTNEICQNECIQFTNLSTIHPSDNITNYYWLIGGQQYSVNDPLACFGNGGTYGSQLIAESSTGCRDTLSRPNSFTVYNIPVAGFEAFLIDDENTSTKIQIQDQSQFGNEFRYTFGDGDSSSLQNPQHIYFDSGFYDVTQIVRNSFGCADTLTKVVYVQILTVYVPNTFTPDGDGINEGFVPVVNGDDPDSYLFRVFDRWGELLFETQKKDFPWDGTYKGENCKTDSYVWTLRTKYSDGDREFDYRGHVNLLR